MPVPKKPEDHRDADTFTYEFEAGSVTFPKYKKVMTFGKGRAMRHLPEEHKIYTLIEENASEEALALMDELQSTEINGFIEAWQKDSGITSGESKAS